MTGLQLFLSFLQVGLFSVGGGYAAIPLIESQVVRAHGWLTMGEFTHLVTIAEMTPGPIAVNAATFVGIRIAGVPGAVIATLGCIAPSVLIVSLMAAAYRRYHDLALIREVLGSLRPAVVALIASAGLSLLRQAVFSGGEMGLETVKWAEAGIFLAALFALRRLRWNPILTMALCGAAGLCAGLARG